MAHYQLNLRQLLCPLPVIRLQEKIKKLQKGDTLEIFCTDPGTLEDIPAWCRINGHEILKVINNGQEITITILTHTARKT